MLIVLDTSALRRDFLLRSTKSETLLDYAKRTGAQFVLPQIVHEELERLYAEELRSRWAKTQKAQQQLSELLLETPNLTAEPDILRATQRYMEEIRARLKVIRQLGVIPYKDSYLPDLVTRAIQRQAPLGRDKAQEFRDGILWLTVLDLATTKNQEVVLISGNTRDFAEPNGGGLLQDLAAEAERRGAKVQFYSTVDDFLRAHADKIAFITSERLSNCVDLGELGHELELTLRFDGRRDVALWLRKYDRQSIELEDVRVFKPVLSNYFVNEMSDGSFRVEIRVTAEIEVEYKLVKETDPGKIDEGYNTASGKVTADYSVKVIGDDVRGIDLDEWFLN